MADLLVPSGNTRGKIYVQETAPTLADGVVLECIWGDQTALATKRCTSLSPVTFAAVETGAPTFAVPTGNIDIGDSASEGSSGNGTRADHQHTFTAPSAGYPLDVAAAENDGTATTPARSDHVHAHGSGYLANAHHNQSHSSSDHTEDYVNVTGDTMTGALAITLAGVGLAVTQDGYFGGYLRVGSATAPNNITAGDITGIRLSIGNVAITSGTLADIRGTLTETASGGKPGLNSTITFSPAADSASTFRAMAIQALHAASSGVLLTSAVGQSAVYFENRVRNDGLITRMMGFQAEACIIDSSSPATLSITTLIGMDFTLFNRTSGTSTMTITTGVGVDIVLVSSADAGVLTATTLIGFRVNAPGAGTYTTLIGMDIASLDAAGTTNIGVRIAQPGLDTGLGSTTDSLGFTIPTASVVMGNQTATTTNAHGIALGIITYTSTTNTRTLTNCATLYIAGAPVASTNITVTNGPYAIWVDSGNTRFDSMAGTTDMSAVFGGPIVDGASFTLASESTRTAITSVGSQLHLAALTRNFDNASSTIAIGANTFFGIPTYTGNSATLTMTAAATVYIQGAPVASTNVAITTAYSLWIDAGNARFDGTILSNGGAQTICDTTGNLASANGANFGPGVPVSITVVNGIVTAVS